MELAGNCPIGATRYTTADVARANGLLDVAAYIAEYAVKGTEQIGGVPRRSCRRRGGWAALPFPGNGVSCADCAPRPMPVYYIADGSREASRLGAAVFVAPAATRGAAWLVSYRARAVMPATAATAQEFSVSGAALGPRRRLPRGYVIDQGTVAGWWPPAGWRRPPRSAT